MHLVGGISSAGRTLPPVDGRTVCVERASGPYLWDRSGERFVDTAMGFGATLLGHNVTEVIESIVESQQRMMMPAFAHAYEEEAAAALAACTGPLNRVVFTNTGSEAVHLACRAARAATGRRVIAKFSAAYDGWYDPVAFGNVQSDEAKMPDGARPRLEDMVLLRYNDFADVDRLFAEFPSLAAVLVEPVLANAGCVEPAPGYLQYLCDTAHRYGALVILDEVLMGFRLHAGLCGHLYGVDADLATVGKAIGNGVPVAAVLGKADVMSVFETGRAVRAGTYSGNPPACAAVTATLRLLVKKDYGALLQRGEALRRDIAAAFAEVGTKVVTTGFGDVFTLWRANTPPTNYTQALASADSQWTRDIHDALRRQGVLTMPFAFGRIYLSFAHDEAAVEAIRSAFVAVAANMIA
jgi:glutamate-1-semialdehyde 2,1-aminomutase